VEGRGAVFGTIKYCAVITVKSQLRDEVKAESLEIRITEISQYFLPENVAHLHGHFSQPDALFLIENIFCGLNYHVKDTQRNILLH
jgi:hypothetical protein